MDTEGSKTQTSVVHNVPFDDSEADIVWTAVALTHVEYPKGTTVRFIMNDAHCRFFHMCCFCLKWAWHLSSIGTGPVQTKFRLYLPAISIQYDLI